MRCIRCGTTENVKSIIRLEEKIIDGEKDLITEEVYLCKDCKIALKWLNRKQKYELFDTVLCQCGKRFEKRFGFCPHCGKEKEVEREY